MIIWIASYPKSGNTWVRSLLSTYLYKENGKNVFENIKKIINFPNKTQFENIFNIDEFSEEELKDKKKQDIKKFQISKYWIKAQSKINLKKEITFLKTHNMGGTLQGYDFSNSENTLGVIYIVRDPRSVAVSNAYHNGISFDQSVNDLFNEKIFATNDGNLIDFRSSWRVNYLSWRNRSYPKIIVRYEDLHTNTTEYFKKILNFISNFKNIEINNLEVKKTIHLCSIENLSNLEEKNGFEEKAKKSEKFFRKGSIDEWKIKLTKDQIKKIEENFKAEMIELKYL